MTCPTASQPRPTRVSVSSITDALRTDGGRPALPDAVYSDDMEEAMASVVKLGALDYETLLVGHGDPVETGAAALVATLAAGG